MTGADNASKIHASDNFTEEKKKLWVFLVKLELYIKFNKKKFFNNQHKTLFTTTYLKNAVFNWINLHLQEFMKQSNREKKEDMTSIFNSWSHYCLILQWAFKVIDEKQAAKWRIYVLQQKKSAVKYVTEFQCLAALTKWKNDILVYYYYHDLKKSIKNEIFRDNQSEQLQHLIN